MRIVLAEQALFGFVVFVLQCRAYLDGDFKYQPRIRKIGNKISSLRQSGRWMFRLQTQESDFRDNTRYCRNSSLTGRMKSLARLETVAKRDIFNNFITSVIASGRYTENDCLYIDLQTAYNTVTNTLSLFWGTNSRFQPNAYNFPWEGGEMPSLNREFCTCVSPRTNAAYGYVVKPTGTLGCDEKHPGICQYMVATATASSTDTGTFKTVAPTGITTANAANITTSNATVIAAKTTAVSTNTSATTAGTAATNTTTATKATGFKNFFFIYAGIAIITIFVIVQVVGIIVVRRYKRNNSGRLLNRSTNERPKHNTSERPKHHTRKRTKQNTRKQEKESTSKQRNRGSSRRPKQTALVAKP